MLQFFTHMNYWKQGAFQGSKECALWNILGWWVIRGGMVTHVWMVVGCDLHSSTDEGAV